MDRTESVARELRETVLLAVATFVWVGTLALASFGPQLWGSATALGWAAIGVNLVAGVAWIVVHGRFLRAGGELERKIMLDAIAIALGVGLVGGFAMAAAENAGLLEVEGDLSIVSVLIALTYIVAIAVGRVRYR